MFFLSLLETNLKTTFIGKKITYYTITESTNDDVWELFQEGGKEGLAVVTDHQTKGRGQRNNKWFSKPGHGIICSFLINEKFDRSHIGMHSVLIAVGIINGIYNLLNIDLKIKWPNDIYHQDKKIGGILIETKLQKNKIFFNVGFGINANENIEDFPTEIQNKSTSINIICGKPIQRELLTAYILNAIDKLFNNINYQDLINVYNEKCINVNHKVSFQLNNKLETGIFKKINKKGQSIIEFNNKSIEYPGVITSI